jgi:tetratricopeptide (TPR) repeat protein
LGSLSSGQPADVWIAETLAANVLAPRFQERQVTDWEWRITAFNKIPPVIREQSKTILHHMARCLYLSVNSEALDLSVHDKRARIENAIEKLKKATVSARRQLREEHPSHLYNTLGTAYYRYARLLEESGATAGEVAEAWKNACAGFEQAIRLSGGSNIEALLAFSKRLLEHSTSGKTVEEINDLAQCLSFLDDADEVLQTASNPEPDWRLQIEAMRTEAFGKLKSERATEHITALKESANAELGYYCEARLAVRMLDPDRAREEALKIFEQASTNGVILGARSLRLKLSLLSRDPKSRFDFGTLKEIYELLEKQPNGVLREIDMYRHAVLCYQTGDFQQGKERFRKLREYSRASGNAPPPARDYLRDALEPENPHLVHAKVSRILSEWRGDAYVEFLQQTVSIRPRQFSPPPQERTVVECAIRFDFHGPIAVPRRLAARNSQ